MSRGVTRLRAAIGDGVVLARIATLAIAGSVIIRFGWLDAPEGWPARVVACTVAAIPALIVLPGLRAGRRQSAIIASLVGMVYAMYASLGLLGPGDAAWHAWVLFLAVLLFAASLRVARAAPMYS